MKALYPIHTTIFYKRIFAFIIHAFTASGACFGLLALYAILKHQWITAFWFMAITIFIDAVDGTFARLFKVKEHLPQVDGALLDNIVDFFNYTLVPCFFLLVSNLIPNQGRIICIVSIVLASAYQFTQIDAKTNDHFFKGFPSYWNIAVFYLFFWQFSETINLILLFTLVILSFVPIKYIYPSRLDYLTRNKALRTAMVFATSIWGVATLSLLLFYPHTNILMASISEAYLILYAIMSLYRTLFPLNSMELASK